MQKLNILFPDCHQRKIEQLSSEHMNSKSEIARAAMSIGLASIQAASVSLTDRELYKYIIDSQSIFITKTGSNNEFDSKK